jgi:leader peptidase (prepilin peptidase)/N-methyltransferase
VVDGEAFLTDAIAIISGAVAGLLAGSFIATAAIRVPNGESALVGRSRCDHCGAALPAANLVPVLSYVVQGGRARCCGSRIDPIHPEAELLAALIGATSALLPLPFSIASCGLGWQLLMLGLVDLRSFRLPNLLVAPLAITGLAASITTTAPSIADSLIGMLAGFLVLEAIRLGYRALKGRDGIGRGDPKLLGAIGAWLGWQPLPTALLAAALTGLAWALVSLSLGRRVARSQKMPLGTLLALAAWPVWVWKVAALFG